DDVPPHVDLVLLADLLAEVFGLTLLEEVQRGVEVLELDHRRERRVDRPRGSPSCRSARPDRSTRRYSDSGGMRTPAPRASSAGRPLPARPCARAGGCRAAERARRVRTP